MALVLLLAGSMGQQAISRESQPLDQSDPANIPPQPQSVEEVLEDMDGGLGTEQLLPNVAAEEQDPGLGPIYAVERWQESFGTIAELTAAVDHVLPVG